MSDAPRRDEPFRFTEEQPEPEPAPAMTWAMRILGLVAVAVLSGVVYWYINDEPAGSQQANPSTSKPAPEGIYQFTPHPQLTKPRTDSDCAKHAYGPTKQFLAQQGMCEKVTQALYTTKVGERTALVSVSVVHMASPDKAIALVELTKRNGTGNVSDAIRDKAVKVSGIDNLSNGYADRVLNNVVTIVEADFSPAGTKNDENVLDAMCEDAVRLGAQIEGA